MFAAFDITFAQAIGADCAMKWPPETEVIWKLPHSDLSLLTERLPTSKSRVGRI